MPLRGSDKRVVVAGLDIARRPAVAVGHPEAGTEFASIEDPTALRSFFEHWAKLGPDIFLAPTQHATPLGLKSLGATQQCFQVNRVAVETLQGVAATMERPALVAAQIGALPTNGDEVSGLEFDEAYIQYHEQVKPIAIAGPDLVVIRGIDALRNMRGLFVQKVGDLDSFMVKLVLLVADILDTGAGDLVDLSHIVLQLGLIRQANLATDDHTVGGGKGFGGNARLGFFGDQRIENGI